MNSRYALRHAWIAGLVASGLSLTGTAWADGIIKHPGDHPAYAFEAEPHLGVAYTGGFGPGFRGTITLLDNGFISSINNSIGVGFGLDWMFWGDGCHLRNDHHCGHYSDVMLPLVMQWNFWVHPSISVFGEPGIVIHARSGNADHFDVDPFVIYVGARFHFSETVALTLRLGAPLFDDSVLSVGASFLL